MTTGKRQDRVVYVGCTEAGFDLLRYVHEELTVVDEVLTLTPEQGRANSVAGYFDYRSYATREGIEVTTPQTYSMNNEEDIGHFREQGGDVMIVHGWQRLIPGEILDCFTHGALGLHGSAFGLPKGRGRSPMNWSLIEGLDRFLLSLLHLDEGADSGGVIETKKYDINIHDDIRTLYYKLVLATQEMLDDVLLDGLENGFDTETQDGEPTYYPKRGPEDGAIDWRDPTRVTYNLIRAVAAPYPGAFTEYDGEKVYIWDAQPFSPDFVFGSEPGTINKVFTPTDDFVVETSDGTLLVTDWEADDWEPERGMTFTSLENDSIDSPNRVDRYSHKDSLTGS